MDLLVKATAKIDLLDLRFDQVAGPAADWLYWSMYDEGFFPAYVEQLAAAYQAGTQLEIEAEFAKSWRTVPAHLFGRIRAAIEGLTHSQARILTVNEAAQEYASTNAGRLVTELTKQQAAAVNDLVSTGIERGWTDQHLANQLSRVVGQNSRTSAAVARYRQGLIDNGMHLNQADGMANKYAQSLLRTRTRTIARTEMAKALNAGQRQMWLDALDDGQVSRSVRSQWVLHPSERTCDHCRQYAGSVSKPLAKGGGYAGNVEGPPLHPNCRCTEKLVDQGVIKIDLEWLIEKHEQGRHDQLEHGLWSHGWGSPTPGSVNTHSNDKIVHSLAPDARIKDKYKAGTRPLGTGAGLQLGSREDILKARELAGNLAKNAPHPTDWEIVHNAVLAQRRVIDNNQARHNGSVDDRLDRTDKLLALYPGGAGKCVCPFTGRLLKPSEFEQDRIIPDNYGGRYTMWNLSPVLPLTNKGRGNKDFPFGKPKWMTKQFQDHANGQYQKTKRLFQQYHDATGSLDEDGFWDWVKTGKKMQIPEKKNAIGKDPTPAHVAKKVRAKRIARVEARKKKKAAAAKRAIAR